ncbi:MAG: glycosyltransferase, partial [Treponema sp.]|nr:glycosyltransferase [Treponema sp.]
INCFDILPRNCKICAVDADAPEVAFWNKSNLKKYYSRYIFLGMQTYSKEMYERYLSKNLESNYLYFPAATVVKSENLEKDKNISFIGSNFYPEWIPDDPLFYSDVALKLYDEFRNDYFYPYKDAKEKYNVTELLFIRVRGYYCGQERLKYLQQIDDLGLKLYGIRWWNHIAYYDFDIAKCFDPTPIVTIEENQQIYNTSKVSMNISHPLAKSCFSWRVMDIMASSSCLLTEDKPDWRNLFGKYLSKEVIETVLYKDRFDMREKAIKLLNNEKFRLRCVKELNNAIEQNGRWEVRFKTLSDCLNIPLLNVSKNVNNLIFVKKEENEGGCSNLTTKIQAFFACYERISEKIKCNQFHNLIILFLIALILFCKVQYILSKKPIIPNDILILFSFGISVIGIILLTLAFLSKPIISVLRVIKKIFTRLFVK